MAPDKTPRWRTPHGAETHRSILRAAIDLATVEGLEGLSLQRLASALAMSKSGLFAHFGSKEELQLATIEDAAREFFDAVVRPAMQVEPGLPRLHALCDAWVRHGCDDGVPGKGRFFAAVTMELSPRPGPVRDRVVMVMRAWMMALESALVVARDLGQLAPDIDTRQLAFELNAFAVGAHWSRTVVGDTAAAARARGAIFDRLASITVRPRRRRIA